MSDLVATCTNPSPATDGDDGDEADDDGDDDDGSKTEIFPSYLARTKPASKTVISSRLFCQLVSSQMLPGVWAP